VEPAIVIDESQLLKFIHEKVDAGPRGADHFRQRLLRHFGKDELRLFMIAVARQQQESSRVEMVVSGEVIGTTVGIVSEVLPLTPRP